MVREADIDTFAAALAAGAAVVDVRDPEEYVAGHVPGALLVPLNTLPHRMQDLPSARPLYIICASGARSAAAAEWLGRGGLDAVSVAGGTGAWMRTGRQVVRGVQAA
jgi:rhodanese-related sulfurtransferase